MSRFGLILSGLQVALSKLTYQVRVVLCGVVGLHQGLSICHHVGPHVAVKYSCA
jgi:hypothetical protein